MYFENSGKPFLYEHVSYTVHFRAVKRIFNQQPWANFKISGGYCGIIMAKEVFYV